MTIIYPWVLCICLIINLCIIHHQDIFISLEVTHGPWKHSIQQHCLLPMIFDIFLSVFGIHISCSLFLLFTSSEMFLMLWRKTYTYQIVWNFPFFAGKWVACILYHRDLELSCDGLWFVSPMDSWSISFLLFLLGPLLCFPVGSLSCPG